MKRFYTHVDVSPERGIMLDKRPVKTPAKAPFILPNDALASAVADEWRAQGSDIDPLSMPMTGLANAAIDHVTANPADFGVALSRYAETELLCYRAEDPPALIDRQNTVWNPILDWARIRFDIDFTLVSGIMHQPQPPNTLTRLTTALGALPPFVLAAFNPLITISGSLVIALAIYDRAIDGETAFTAAHLDELWQAELWGEDDFALEARAVHRRDFLNAARFLDLVRDNG
jgi:chaperone required for assembly of F1-ATPase